MPGHFFRADVRRRAKAIASIFLVIRIEYEPVISRDRQTDAKSFADKQREVADADNAPPRRRRDTHKGQGVPLHIPPVYPLETGWVVVGFPQGRLFGIKAVEVAHKRLQAQMKWLLKQMPVKAAFLVPLSPLAQLSSHKEQLLSGMCPHVAVEGTQVGELVRTLARHLVQERTLAMHDLIM